MGKSGVYEIFNKTAMVERSLFKSADMAIRQACLSTEARAKQEITHQVYSGTDIKARTNGPTGAARASIHCVFPGHDGYAEAIAEAKALAAGGGHDIEVFPQVQISHTEQKPEGIVAVGVLYGFYIEFGTTRVYVSIPPRPYMTPAVEAVAPEFEKFCLEYLKAELK